MDKEEMKFQYTLKKYDEVIADHHRLDHFLFYGSVGLAALWATGKISADIFLGGVVAGVLFHIYFTAEPVTKSGIKRRRQRLETEIERIIGE